MLDAEKAAEGVIKSVKDFVARAVDPLTTHVDELDAKLKEGAVKRAAELSDETLSKAITRGAIDRLDDKLGGIEKRLDATNAAIGEAVEPFAVRLTGIEAKAEEAANTERFRPFLETALDAVRKESGSVDAKMGEIEKRLEATAAGAVDTLFIKIGVLDRRFDEVAKSIPADQTENIRKAIDGCADLGQRLAGIDTRLYGVTKAVEGVEPIGKRIDGLLTHIEDVAKRIPADQSDEISKAGDAAASAREEISAVCKRIDGIEPRLEGLAKTAAEVTPITERVIRLETRYEDVKRDAIDAGIAKAIDDFSGKTVSPLNDKIGTFEARLADVAKSAVEAVTPLTTKIDDLSSRFKEIGAANDALQEQILKSVDVQIVEAVKRLPSPKDGEHGKDGVNAYQIAVNKGFSGSEDEWLSSLKGSNGIAGESIIGPRGEAGRDAEQVDKEWIVKEVAALIPVPKDGKDGEDGVAGKDAAQVDIALVVKEVVAQIPVPKDGADGKDGKDAEPVSDELVRAEIAKAVAELPKPKEIPPEVVAELVAAEVQKAVSELPKATDGKDGLAGKDAEPVDVAKVIADVVSRMPVPKDGERGPPGESIVGLKGEPGRDVPIEVVSALVAGEVAKAIGAMPKAEKARDGEDGRDALHIEVLPMIDTGKSAPRGTFASHNGGLWRAARNTDAGEDLHLCGWQSLVEGFPEIEIDQGDDLRTFTFRAVSSTGRKIEKLFSLPVVIDRGVYKVDRWYEPGDSVSQRGCGWIAQRKTQAVPGMNDDWRLSVKAGRDGKDAALLLPKQPQQVRLK